jgi:biotin carboxyl carrier protein
MAAAQRQVLKSLAVLAAFALSSCGGVSHLDIAPPAEASPEQPPAADTSQSDSATAVSAPLSPAHIAPRCSDEATQGGAILCRVEPGAVVQLDGKPIARADGAGLAIIGLTRTQPSPAVISVGIEAGGARYPVSISVPVFPRNDTVTKFTMECGKIAPQSPADKHKAEVSWVKKDKALHGFNAPLAPFDLEGPVKLEGVSYSSSFGATRTYVPKTKDCEPTTSVHNGTDIAVGKGTDIYAPMAGTVLLADPDLFYEGGAVFLDMGYGLVSVTMHMSRIDVKAGEVVKQGDLLGLSGATGRVTGPHLHWAIRYRNVFSDDRGTDIWLDPMLMLKAKAPE